MGGTKAGVIAYLGETKFAGGDWAGVILDELEGKNDGMVQGIRYFQCEPKRGVFAKPSKLSRHKINRYIYFFLCFGVYLVWTPSTLQLVPVANAFIRRKVMILEWSGQKAAFFPILALNLDCQ